MRVEIDTELDYQGMLTQFKRCVLLARIEQHGMNQTQIAKSLNLNRGTTIKYLKQTKLLRRHYEIN